MENFECHVKESGLYLQRWGMGGEEGTGSERGERQKPGPDRRQLQSSRWEAITVEIQEMTE